MRCPDFLANWLHWLAIRVTWGKRCPDYEASCPTCRHWAEHDEIFDRLSPASNADVFLAWALVPAAVMIGMTVLL